MKRFPRHSIAACGFTRGFAKGFTLLEILVVVGIILLLAGLLFPAFARARDNGKRASCMSNLKQIALASQLYLQNYDLRFPPIPPAPPPMPPPPGEDDEGKFSWANLLLNVAQSEANLAVFQCPSEEDRTGGVDYWMNFNLLGLYEGRVRYNANVFLCGDGVYNPPDYALGPDSEYGEWKPDEGYAVRHLDGANYSFVDGHVKWLLPNQISTTDDPNGSNFTFVIG